MKDKKDIQYKIFKSEACGHAIQYKMVDSNNLKKNENRLQNQLATHAIQGKKTGIKLLDNMIADAKDEKRMATPAEREELSHNLRVKKEKEKEKTPQKLAASEEDCKCEDETKKCECEDKEMKKREKFYIQKIQELRKQAPSSLNLRQMYNIENSPARRDAAKARAGLEEAPSPSPYQSYNIKNSPARRDAIQAKAGNVKNFLTGQTSAPAAPASNMSMPGQAPAPQAAAPAPQAAAPAPQAAAPAAQAPQSFGQAFKAARAARMGGTGSDTFEFGGKKYHSFTKDDFSQGLGSKYNSTTKQAPAAQAPAAQAPAAQAPVSRSGIANEVLKNARQEKEKISPNENSNNPAFINPAFAKDLGESKMLRNSLTPYRTTSPDLSVNPNTVIQNQKLKPENRKNPIQPNSSAVEAMAKPKNLA